MSDIVVNDPAAGGAPPETSELFLDGDAPRLGAAPTIAAPPAQPSAPVAPVAPVAPTAPAVVPSLPVVSPVLSSPATPLLPDAPAVADHPIEPGAAPAPSTTAQPTLPSTPPPNPHIIPETTEQSPADADPDAEPEHPMAHLMPAKSKPTEASRRAAEIRAAQKAKGKKIKIGVIAGMLLFTAVVGPPLGKWLVDAINEAGDTSSVEEPAE